MPCLRRLPSEAETDGGLPLGVAGRYGENQFLINGLAWSRQAEYRASIQDGLLLVPPVRGVDNSDGCPDNALDPP